MVEAQDFLNSYEDPTRNVDSDAEEEKLYYKFSSSKKRCKSC